MVRTKPRSRRIPGRPSLHFLHWAPSGEPLLLLHGMGGNAYWWEKTASRLAGQFQVAALDFRGHGDSDWMENGHYDLDGFLEDIESARKYLGWERMHLGAHSMGARVALSYAQRWPARIRKLVAVDFRPELEPSRIQKFNLISRVKQPIYPNIKAILSRFRLEPSATVLDRNSLERLARHCIRKVEGGYTWKFDWRVFRFYYGSVRPEVEALRVETLIVRGAKSDMMGSEILQEALRAIPGAQGVEIAKAYHHVPLDAPEELAVRMRDFLIAKSRAA